MTRDDLPRGVFPKGRWYYLVVAEGKKRIWHKLSRLADGLPALYTALAAKKVELAQPPEAVGKMPALIGLWEREVMPAHAPKTQIDDRARGKMIAEAFIEYLPEEMDTPGCSDFLAQFKAKPRTFNAYRALLREYMRFAEEKGRRSPGTNPTQAIRTMRTKARERCPTTSELRRIKIGCIYGDNGRPNRSGLTMACLIEMAYLSGQDVGVMIKIREQQDPAEPGAPHVCADGIFFRRTKTGKAVIIEWTQRLRDVVKRLGRLKAERKLKKRAAQRVDTDFLFTKQDGQPLTYEAVSNAWQRGVRRAKVAPVMFRDIRARALTDKDYLEGMREAQKMGTHGSESQTADYIRHKAPRRTGATR